MKAKLLFEQKNNILSQLMPMTYLYRKLQLAHYVKRLDGLYACITIFYDFFIYVALNTFQTITGSLKCKLGNSYLDGSSYLFAFDIETLI